jgi:phosphate transport system permease protein
VDAEQYGEETGLEIMNKATNINPDVFSRRKRANKIGLTLSMSAMVLGMIFLFWILSVLIIKGFSSVDLALFIQSTPAPGSDGGGLANAIVGSLMLVACCTLLARLLACLQVFTFQSMEIVARWLRSLDL